MAYRFIVHMDIEASDEYEAKHRAEESIDNLEEMTGHAPYGVQLFLAEDPPEEVDDEDDNDHCNICDRHDRCDCKGDE